RSSRSAGTLRGRYYKAKNGQDQLLPKNQTRPCGSEILPRTLHHHLPQHREVTMHHSRLCALLIDCNTTDIDSAADFWAKALGRPVDPDHPGTRGNYRMLETPPDEPIVQLQRVEHECRVHIDI